MGFTFFRLPAVAFLWVALASASVGQLTVDSRSAVQLSGIEQAEQIGTAIFVASDSTVARLPVILVTATTEAANITFEVSDRDRVPIAFEQLTPTTIMISESGKSWVRVVAIDFESNIYATKLLPVELGPAPPGPTPPDPPTPPLPPDGPFDALAVRVAVIAAQMATSERDQLIDLLTAAADRMKRFDFRTLDQVRNFVEDGWTKTEPAKQLQAMLAEDAQERVLSWAEAQKYYLEIAKGLQ